MVQSAALEGGAVLLPQGERLQQGHNRGGRLYHYARVRPLWIRGREI